MKRLLQSFYARLAAVFLLVLILLVVLQILFTTRAYRAYTLEVDQRLNQGLAADMTRELDPLLGDSLDFQRIGERIHYMMVLNPKIEIYLLDPEGFILAFFAEPGKRVEVETVDLEPINRFLQGREDFPILGADPRQPGRSKPFSVAGLTLPDGKSGYLYIIIGGQQYDSVLAVLRGSFLFRSLSNGLILAVVLAALVGLLLFAWLTGRFRRLASAVHALEAGNLETRIPVTSEDEVGQLARSFNAMADSIQEKVVQLQENDRLRRELVANVSHDLRTPLAAVQGYLETIQMKPDLPGEEQKHYLQTMHRSLVGLNHLVEELFELSKLEARQIQPDLEDMALADLVQDVVQGLDGRAMELGLALKMDVSGSLPLVRADLRLLERVLLNLISNALEFTPAGGEVRVILSQAGQSARVAIKDTGPGIPEADLPHVFDRYYRSGQKQGPGSTSTGLGLTIAYMILQAHDSQLEVQSQPEQGTTFAFLLPAV